MEARCSVSMTVFNYSSCSSAPTYTAGHVLCYILMESFRITPRLGGLWLLLLSICDTGYPAALQTHLAALLSLCTLLHFLELYGLM